MSIKELEEKGQIRNLTISVIKVRDKFTTSGNKVLAKVEIEDSSGSGILNLWDEDTGLPIKEGSELVVINGYCGDSYDGVKQINLGKYGSVKINGVFYKKKMDKWIAL